MIFIVRHGETDANVKKKINDRNVVTPLNRTGKAQASKTGKYLNKFCSSNSCIIYSSPSICAVQTAKIIASKMHVNEKNIILDDRINEIDYGLLSSSVENDDIHKKYMEDRKKLPKDPI